MRPLGNGGAGRRRWLEHDAAHAAARLVPAALAGAKRDGLYPNAPAARSSSAVARIDPQDN